jgi:hypothetical protein
LQAFEKINPAENQKNVRSYSQEIIQIVHLKQFMSQRKAWFVAINYALQVILIEFVFPNPQLAPTEQTCLKTLHVETITKDNLQPFSLCNLLNSKVERNNVNEMTAEVVLGCAKGTIIIYEITTQRRPVAVVGGVKV